MIYLVSHYYLPLGNPPANRMGRLARALVERYGADRVLVVTGRRNYPDGKLQARHKWKIACREKGPAGESVQHLYEIPAPFRGFYRKTLGYLSFAVSVFFFFLFRPIRREDLILVTSGPVFPAYAIWLLSRFRRNMRYIVDVRDLSPQTVAGMGFMNERAPAYRLLKALSDRTYRAAVSTVGAVPGICNYLQSVTRADKVTLVYNPVDMELMKPLPDEAVAVFRKAHADLFGQSDDVVFVFAGAHSVYMDLMTLMLALSKIRENPARFRFILIGYGEEKDRLQRYVAENGLAARVTFLPHMDRTELVKHVCASDFGFFSCKADPIFDMVVAVKVMEYLACDKFVLCAQNGPFPEELSRLHLAMLSKPNNPAELAECILRLTRDRDKYRKQRNVARQFATEWFSAEQFARRYLTVVENSLPSAPE